MASSDEEVSEWGPCNWKASGPEGELQHLKLRIERSGCGTEIPSPQSLGVREAILDQLNGDR